MACPWGWAIFFFFFKTYRKTKMNLCLVVMYGQNSKSDLELKTFFFCLAWETMWSLILYVVCSMYVVCMCMYVCGNFCKIDNCIHIHWRIPMGLGHNDPWAQSHMWPQQMWGQRSSRGQWPLVQVLAKSFTISTYFDVFSWDLDKMILG